MRVPLPPSLPLNQWPDLTLLASCVWAEGRGEPFEGQRQIAFTVMERVRRGGWFGDGVKGVILRDTNHDGLPEQYSAFRPRDKGGELDILWKPLEHSTELAWESAWHAAAEAFFGLGKAPFPGATHYHASNIMPEWAKRITLLGQIGHQLYYTDAKVVAA